MGAWAVKPFVTALFVEPLGYGMHARNVEPFGLEVTTGESGVFGSLGVSP